MHLDYTEFIKQYEIKSGTRENNVIKSHSKHKIYEAAASVTQYTDLQQTLFLRVERYTLK